MKHHVGVFVVLLCSSVAALAQGGGRIQWIREPEQAVAQARKANLPLMCYVLSGEKDRDDKLDGKQKRAFADPRVVRLSERFVCLQLSRSRHRNVLEQFHLSPAANMEISFVGTDGSEIDHLSPGGVAEPASLAQKMAAVFKVHREQLFEKDIKPVLENKDATPAELRSALERVRMLTILDADKAVAALLDRQPLDASVASAVYEVLAYLSTKDSVSKLLERSAAGDIKSTEALTKCTPAGAEAMFEHLRGDDGTVRVDVYRAVGKICKINNLKPDPWWTKANKKIQDQEVERVQKIVEETAKRWKAMYEEYR